MGSEGPPRFPLVPCFGDPARPCQVLPEPRSDAGLDRLGARLAGRVPCRIGKYSACTPRIRRLHDRKVNRPLARNAPRGSHRPDLGYLATRRCLVAGCLFARLCVFLLAAERREPGQTRPDKFQRTCASLLPSASGTPDKLRREAVARLGCGNHRRSINQASPVAKRPATTVVSPRAGVLLSGISSTNRPRDALKLKPPKGQAEASLYLMVCVPSVATQTLTPSPSLPVPSRVINSPWGPRHMACTLGCRQAQYGAHAED